MGSTDPSQQPIVQPRLVRLIKRRPKLVGGDAREEFWEHVEGNIAQRRQPDTAAEKAVQKLFEETADAAAPTARERVRSRLEQANTGALENI